MQGWGDALAKPVIVDLSWCYSSVLVLLKVTHCSSEKTEFKLNLSI